jgi:hypothetical protein
MRICLRRREFIAVLGGAAVLPVAGSAQQRAMPVVAAVMDDLARRRVAVNRARFR